MITDIDKMHPIFKSEKYIKDIVPFGLIELIKETPKILKSNEKNFIVGMIAPQMPTWVWTADDIDLDSIEELKTFFFELFKNAEKVRFVAKPHIADILSEPFIIAFKPQIKRIGMESFENPKIIPAKNKQVAIEKPIQSDATALSECFSGFYRECFEETVTAESLLAQAEKKIEKGILWVIKDKGIVVATAEIARENSTHIGVSGVYVKPEYRCQGLAAALVAHICEYIKEQGKIPSLYTDLSNPSSNKAYINVGFVKCGKVDEVNLSWVSQKD